MYQTLGLSVFCAVLLAGPAAADKLTAATLADYIPYSDAKAPDKGFSPDVLVEALKRAGHEVEVQVTPWPRALQGTIDGQFDVTTTVWKSPEREKTLMFSDAFVTNRIVFAKPAASDFEFSRLADLTGKTVGTVIGYGYGDDFLKNPDFKRDETINVASNLRKLAAGRIDLTLEDELMMKYLINTQLPEIKGAVGFTRGFLSDNPAYMVFSRKNPKAEALAADFNRGLAAMKADGTYDRLLEKHKMK